MDTAHQAGKEVTRSTSFVEVVSMLMALFVLSSWDGRSWAHDDERHPHSTDPMDPPQGVELNPFFAGSLMSLSGRTMPQGSVAARAYWLHNEYGGFFNENWRLQSTDTIIKNQQVTFLIFGLTKAIDFIVIPQWVGRHDEDDYVKFGDLPIAIGFQAFRPLETSWLPWVRVFVQQLFPTGSYQNLAPTTSGTPGSGGGSYATTLGVAVEKAFHLSETHFLRTRVNALYTISQPVDVQGFNSYGGGFGTNGRVEPGTVTSVTLAGELTLSRHIAIALDLNYQSANATSFFGASGVTLTGAPAQVGSGYNALLMVAPAIEFNYSEKLGLVVGVPFSAWGRNKPQFVGLSVVLQTSFELFK
jgi:hypothetical protein